MFFFQTIQENFIYADQNVWQFLDQCCFSCQLLVFQRHTCARKRRQRSNYEIICKGIEKRKYFLYFHKLSWICKSIVLYKLNIFQVFQNKFDLDYELPLVFIDTHFNKSNPEEAEAFKRESDILWKVSMNKKPFQCLTRKDVQDKLVSANSLIEFTRLLNK